MWGNGTLVSKRTYNPCDPRRCQDDKKKQWNLTVADCSNVKKIFSQAVQNIFESVNHPMGDKF